MIGKGLTRRPWVWVSALSALGILCASHSSAKADEDDKSNKAEFIPTGVHITPAAKGSIFQPLNPGLASDPTFTVGQAATTAVSPDGKTLLFDQADQVNASNDNLILWKDWLATTSHTRPSETAVASAKTAGRY